MMQNEKPLVLDLRKLLGVELVEVSAIEKIVSAAGGGLAILALAYISSWVLPGGCVLVVVGSMGASAVLLFAVPHGQLSQPWSVVVGHFVSAVIGVTCARFIPDQTMASACAVGLAIGAMHKFKCIHPPGGATAYFAVMGGAAIYDLGYWYVIIPVLVNSMVIVALAVIINSFFTWRRYPAVLSRPAGMQPQKSSADSHLPTHEEILAAVRSMDSFVDISEEDLVRLTDLLCNRSNHDSRYQKYGKP